jgi:hypothetical protein
MNEELRRKTALNNPGQMPQPVPTTSSKPLCGGQPVGILRVAVLAMGAMLYQGALRRQSLLAFGHCPADVGCP